MFEKKNNNELKLWKLLTNFWSIITLFVFIVTFFRILDLSASLSHLSIIYISLLSLFVGVKEVSRWKDKKFSSRHHGELFVIIWTILMLMFVLLKALRPSEYILTNEFTATYLSIAAIFFISHRSKNLKLK